MALPKRNIRGSFKTAYLQRELVEDVAVVGETSKSTDYVFCVGDLVTYTAPAGAVPGYIAVATSIADATHMIAQSDITMHALTNSGKDVIPFNLNDYSYYASVVGTLASGTPVATTPTKKVALFSLVDKNDIVVYAKEV